MAGSIADALIARAKKGPSASSSGTVSATRAIMDALKADDAEVLDGAIRDWCEAYKAEKPDEGPDEE